MPSKQNGRSSVIILCLWKHRIQYLKSVKDFPIAQVVKNLPAMLETQVQSLGQEDALEKETATHSGTLAWKIQCMDKPGRLQSTGSQRVRHD